MVPWSYKCDEHRRCIRLKPLLALDHSEQNLLSLGMCKLTCGPNSVLLPKPKSSIIGSGVTPVDINQIWFGNRDQIMNTAAATFIQRNIQEQTKWLRGKKEISCKDRPSKNMLRIHVDLSDNTDGEKSNIAPRITKSTNESYTLRVAFDSANSIVHANIEAPCYFGARHALETLFQLIEYDEIGRTFAILNEVDINDAPEFSHRGISVDTARNFIDKERLFKIIDGIAHDKVRYAIQTSSLVLVLPLILVAAECLSLAYCGHPQLPC